jgi:uncharacterized protein YjaG (DUF416 family)
LSTLGSQKTAAFTAACAERLMPLYRQFCEQHWDANCDLERALGAIWEVLLQISPVVCLRPSLWQVADLMPYPDGLQSGLVTVVKNAVTCVDMALRHLLDSRTRLSAVPECVLEAVASVDRDRLSEAWGIGSTPPEAEVKELILPSVQREIIFQRRDVAVLIASTGVAEVVDEIRARACRNAHGQSPV